MERLWTDFVVCVLFLNALKCPLSWHKFRCGTRVRYVGILVLSFERHLELPGEKRRKALGFLRAAATQKTMPRKQFESVLGFLMYISGVARMLRPWLAALFRNKVGTATVIRLTPATVNAACLWSCALKTMPSLLSCNGLQKLPGVGAADACASGGSASIGGWY